MAEESRDERSKNYVLMRTLMDVGMGIIYIGVSLFIIFAKKFGFSSQVFDPHLTICLLAFVFYTEHSGFIVVLKKTISVHEASFYVTGQSLG
jgi:hypothetical protein